MPAGQPESDEFVSEISAVTEIPLPSHAALQPIDADEYRHYVTAQINLELNLLRWCALARVRES